MSLPQGIIFKATIGFDGTPGANDAEETGVTYPWATPQGNNVGWNDSGNVQARDRTTGNDPRLCGTNFMSSIQKDYRIDLPAPGNYNIRCAAGDQAAAGTNQIEVFDNTTSLGVMINSTPAANSFTDAANTDHTAANWPANNAPALVTFASTICIFRFPSTALNEIAYLYIEAAGAVAPGVATDVSKFPKHNLRRDN